MRRTDLIAMAEVETHNKEGDLWVVMNGDVWDLTEVDPSRLLAGSIANPADTRFLPRAQFFEAHPGGATPLLKAAGRDASNVSPLDRRNEIQAEADC